MEILSCINPQCKAKLQKTGSSFVKCGNCKTRFFSFCHEFPNKPHEYVQCRKCTNELYYFFCAKCKGVLCFKNYKMGSTSKCKCGFEGCYVVCNKCHHSGCFPPSRSYEGTPWKCEKCNQPFNFMTCDQCFHPVYGNSFKEDDRFRCQNNKCNTRLLVKTCAGCRDLFFDSHNESFCSKCDKKTDNNGKLNLILGKKISDNTLDNKKPLTSHGKSYSPRNSPNQIINMLPKDPSTEVPKSKPLVNRQSLYTPSDNQTMQKSFGKQIESLCKICLDKPAEFINVKCFHLSCCEKCMQTLKNICPLCRAEGEFHKVYR